jgi:hypothetical protein
MDTETVLKALAGLVIADTVGEFAARFALPAGGASRARSYTAASGGPAASTSTAH